MELDDAVFPCVLRQKLLCRPVLLVLSLLGLIFMGSLVAQPKLLFGRALSAVTPDLFPSIILGLLALLCSLFLISLNRETFRAAPDNLQHTEWKRGAVFFGILTLYALTMLPFGFLISTAIATGLLSRLMGNKSVIQTVLLCIFAPMVLYLAATRLLAVSLPELNAIELAYARLLGG